MRLRNAFKNSVVEAPKLVTTKTLLLKHYYHHQGNMQKNNTHTHGCKEKQQAQEQSKLSTAARSSGNSTQEASSKAENICSKSGVSKGGFCEGGKISIVGVVREPVAIINFASDPCENLGVYTGFNKEAPHKNAKLIIATGARTHPSY